MFNTTSKKIFVAFLCCINSVLFAQEESDTIEDQFYPSLLDLDHCEMNMLLSYILGADYENCFYTDLSGDDFSQNFSVVAFQKIFAKIPNTMGLTFCLNQKHTKASRVSAGFTCDGPLGDYEEDEQVPATPKECYDALIKTYYYGTSGFKEIVSNIALLQSYYTLNDKVFSEKLKQKFSYLKLPIEAGTTKSQFLEMLGDSLVAYYQGNTQQSADAVYNSFIKPFENKKKNELNDSTLDAFRILFQQLGSFDAKGYENLFRIKRSIKFQNCELGVGFPKEILRMCDIKDTIKRENELNGGYVLTLHMGMVQYDTEGRISIKRDIKTPYDFAEIPRTGIYLKPKTFCIVDPNIAMVCIDNFDENKEKFTYCYIGQAEMLIPLNQKYSAEYMACDAANITVSEKTIKGEFVLTGLKDSVVLSASAFSFPTLGERVNISWQDVLSLFPKSLHCQLKSSENKFDEIQQKAIENEFVFTFGFEWKR